MSPGCAERPKAPVCGGVNGAECVGGALCRAAGYVCGAWRFVSRAGLQPGGSGGSSGSSGSGGPGVSVVPAVPAVFGGFRGGLWVGRGRAQKSRTRWGTALWVFMQRGGASGFFQHVGGCGELHVEVEVCARDDGTAADGHSLVEIGCGEVEFNGLVLAVV